MLIFTAIGAPAKAKFEDHNSSPIVLNNETISHELF